MAQQQHSEAPAYPSQREIELLLTQTERDGGWPVSNVIFDANGNLYGTAVTGGSEFCNGARCGVVWEITP